MPCARALLVMPAIAVLCASVHATGSVETVPEGYRRVAAAHDIPDKLLYAVALAESGKRIDALRRTRPWPWTLNIGGEGRYYASRREAEIAVLQAFATDQRSVDIGLMQVNWSYHKASLRSVESAIDPYHNLDVGAQILAGCFRERGDWWAAVGCYHAPHDAKLAMRYRQRVRRIWSRLAVAR